MNDDLNASADTALADTGGSEEGGMSALEQYFANQEQPTTEIDKPADAESEAPDETAVEETEAPAEEAEAAQTEAEPEAEPEAETTEADFKALEKGEMEFPDEEGLRAKYPRQVKAFYQEAAQLSELAKKGQEVVDAIGGETFIPGMTTIAKSLQEGNPRALFNGIVETASADGLVKVLGDAIYLGLVKGDEMAANPETEIFGKALVDIIDGSIKEKFGPNMSVGKMSKLAEWDAAGWFDKIEKWTAETYVDQDELRELLDTTDNPKLIAARQKIAELEAKQGQKDTAAKETSAVQQREIENSFSTLATGEIEKTLTDIVWKSSTLRDIPSDNPETKAEKAFLRDRLKSDAVAIFKNGDLSPNLLEGFRLGKQNTAVFRKEFADAINQAVLATRPGTTVAERMLAKLYGKTRNAQLAQKKPVPDVPNAEKPQPTVTTNYGNKEVRTREEIYKTLEERIAAL